MTESRKDVLERRKKAKSNHDILGDLANTIDKAKGEKPTIIGAIAERRVEKRVMKSANENKKTIRLHPDLRHTLESYAETNFRDFSDVLKEMIMAGLKSKGIDIIKTSDMSGH